MMVRVTCPICSGPHAKWDCKQAAIEPRQRGKSAFVAVATEAALNAGKTVATISPGGIVEVRGPGAAKDITPPASSPSGKASGFGPDTAGSNPAEATTTKRGRPRIHPDRKAYKAQKERERRQRQKEGK
jgi:hypothetical protein